jgi:catechol 2,3-dioxygenase-like lactoylglutathione lyase family enzyme
MSTESNVSPRITGFHHVALNARKSYADACKFYGETLGLTRRVEFVAGGRRISLFDAGGGNYVEVFDETGKPAESKPTTLAHFALRTNDVDAMIARCRSIGLKVTVEPKTVEFPTEMGPSPFKIRIAFVEGPEGESLEFFDEITRLTPG